MKNIIEKQQEVMGLEGTIVQLNYYLKSRHYQFTTVSPNAHRCWLNKNKGKLATDLRDVFGWGFPFERELLDVNLFSLLHQEKIIYSVDHLWKSAIRVSTLDQELFIHSAFPTSHHDSVFFGPDTYRFIHAVNDYLEGSASFIKRAVEVCCGAAPAAITIAKRCPMASVQAIDINPKALEYSAANARAAGVRIDTINNNLFVNFQLYFDLIVANPPFMMDGQKRAYRDGGGMYGAELALRIVTEALERLAVGGTLLIYTGAGVVAGEDIFYQHVQRILCPLTHLEWRYKEIDPDIFSDELILPEYAQVERIAAVVLRVYRKV